ncbi:THUMP domain-containing protein [bacterium]|nr:THUMP domain-containing protein [bacterium]
MKLIAKTFHGLEETLLKELEELGATQVNKVNRAVEFEGDLELLYKANLHLRTCIRILKPIHEFTAKNEDELYKRVREFDWSTLMTTSETLAIDSVVFSEIFTHSKYVALKTKDAIVDQFRDKEGKRPSIDIENPNVQLVVHIARDKVTISLDSSGESLHKRGYRIGNHLAPLNEVLAAGMVMLSGWDKKMALIDPMCGSGTLLMEAVMYAKNYPPGLHKKRFGFMGWRNYDKELWNKIVEKAKAGIQHPRLKIYGSDSAVNAIDIARESALNFRFNRDINFKIEALERLEPERPKGMIIMNPPYDERIKKDNIVQFYKMIGARLKQEFSGYDAWIITSHKEAMNNLGLEPVQKYSLFNGALECKYHKFDLYEGSLKKIIKFR